MAYSPASFLQVLGLQTPGQGFISRLCIFEFDTVLISVPLVTAEEADR